MRLFLIASLLVTGLGGAAPAAPQARILDLKHYSRVFGEERNYRIFLPPDYEANPQKRYPVIYWFHGFGERYNRGPRNRPAYDSGDDYGGDNIAAFVGTHDVIVVKWDGYNPRTPGEDYPRPYNVYPVETYRQFPLYFPELVEYIDATYRTIADREHRATAGLSMGGFMSFWVAGKYPQLVGSASNFMGSSEFYAGPNGFPAEYRHTEMYGNYDGLRTRLVTGKKDFIRWYHRRMNAVWDFTRPNFEHEEFDWEHGTPGMAKTLSFHMNAFRDPLPKPALWRHADVYPAFDVWGYSVESDRQREGFNLLENVSAGGFRSSVREWLPDGPLMPFVTLRVATDAAYRPGALYYVTDVNLDTGETAQARAKAGEDGRLRFILDGARHEIGISETPQPLLTVCAWQVAGAPWAVAGKPVRLEIEVLNKGAAAAGGVKVRFKSRNPQVSLRKPAVAVAALGPGKRASGEIEFLVADPEREIVQLLATAGSLEIPIEVPLYRDAPPAGDFAVADGGKLAIWERAVNRVEKALGAGNGDGVANPGETIAIGVRDGEAFRPVELFTSDACVSSQARLSDIWASYDGVGATAKITLPLISSTCPEGHEIAFFARWQMPNKPEHLLKEAVVRIRVTGRDRTPPQVRWAQAAGWNRLEADIRDGGRVRSATATLKNGEATLSVPLHREGVLFTGRLPNPAPGRYTLTIAAEDEFGNASESAVAGEYSFTLPPKAPALLR